jgi:hypothetical protein
MALTVILVWYAGLGILAAVGTVSISRARFSSRAEHVFFALLLIPVAAVYLAFEAYFGNQPALRFELYAVLLFIGLGLLGLRLPLVLVLGYALHGAWDLLHEVSARGSSSITAIPLAYGAFCAAFDWYVACYFVTRRAAWNAAVGSVA